MIRPRIPKENRMPPWMTKMAQFNQMFPGLSPQDILGLMKAKAYQEGLRRDNISLWDQMMGMQPQQQQPQSLEALLAALNLKPNEIQGLLGGQ